MLEQRPHRSARRHPSPTRCPSMFEELLEHSSVEFLDLDAVDHHPPAERPYMLKQPPHSERRVAPP